LQQNLNGQNDLTRPFLEQFNKLICNYDYNSRNEITKISAGRWSVIRQRNSAKIKQYYKDLLNKLWTDSIETKYFSGASNQANNVNIGAEFQASFGWMVKSFQSDKMYGAEGPEKNEAYTEWYREKDVSNLISNMKELGQHVKEKIEQEKRAYEENGARLRLEKEKNDAEVRHDADVKEMQKQLVKIEKRNEEVKEELEKKLKKKKVSERGGHRDMGGFEMIGCGLGKILDDLGGVTAVAKILLKF
jgi:hypothetical protein